LTEGSLEEVEARNLQYCVIDAAVRRRTKNITQTISRGTLLISLLLTAVMVAVPAL